MSPLLKYNITCDTGERKRSETEISYCNAAYKLRILNRLFQSLVLGSYALFMVLTSAHSRVGGRSLFIACNIVDLVLFRLRQLEPFINFILCINGLFAPRAAGRIIKLG